MLWELGLSQPRQSFGSTRRQGPWKAAPPPLAAVPTSHWLLLLGITCAPPTYSLAACSLACLAGRKAPYLCARGAQVCLCHSHSVPPAGILAEDGLGMGSTGETFCGIIKREQKYKTKQCFPSSLSFLPLALIIFPL